MQAAYGATLFCEMFHGDPNLSVKSTFMNSLWSYCDKYGEFIVNVLKIIAPILT